MIYSCLFCKSFSCLGSAGYRIDSTAAAYGIGSATAGSDSGLNSAADGLHRHLFVGSCIGNDWTAVDKRKGLVEVDVRKG